MAKYSNPVVNRVARNILRKSEDVKSGVNRAVDVGRAVVTAKPKDFVTAPAKVGQYAVNKVKERVAGASAQANIDEATRNKRSKLLKKAQHLSGALRKAGVSGAIKSKVIR